MREIAALRTYQSGRTATGSAVTGRPPPTHVPRRAGRAVVDGKFIRRRGERSRLFGFTYGPFRPQSGGEPFPSTEQARRDFAKMAALGANAIRTYHVPPAWLLETAGEQIWMC